MMWPLLGGRTVTALLIEQHRAHPQSLQTNTCGAGLAAVNASHPAVAPVGLSVFTHHTPRSHLIGSQNSGSRIST